MGWKSADLPVTELLQHVDGETEVPNETDRVPSAGLTLLLVLHGQGPGAHPEEIRSVVASSPVPR